ncbi:RNase H domain-containing protein [Trichonephila clavipes]|nr:RNase H domain-containing protein [Trichonephila clavipes]
MGAHTSKYQDPPEYLRQLALEIINKIPATAMQIYTDGSKDEQNSCGSGMFIKAPNCSHNIKIRNFCSVFRSELIAIDEALESSRRLHLLMKYGYYVIAEVLSNTLATGQMLKKKHRSQFLKILKNFPAT